MFHSVRDVRVLLPASKGGKHIFEVSGILITLIPNFKPNFDTRKIQRHQKAVLLKKLSVLT